MGFPDIAKLSDKHKTHTSAKACSQGYLCCCCSPQHVLFPGPCAEGRGLQITSVSAGVTSCSVSACVFLYTALQWLLWVYVRSDSRKTPGMTWLKKIWTKKLWKNSQLLHWFLMNNWYSKWWKIKMTMIIVTIRSQHFWGISHLHSTVQTRIKMYA